MPAAVYILQVIIKNDLEDQKNLTGRIMKLVQRWCKPGMHAKRNIGYVIVTDETLDELGLRLFDGLMQLKELGSIERFFIYPAPPDLISDHGKIDALAHWMRTGRVEAGERNKAQNMSGRKGWQRRH